MKKILAIALVLLLVFALAVPVFAVDSPGESGGGGGGNTPGGGGNTPGGAKGPSGKSPQTGYNTLVWGITTVAMAVCAGYCFSKSGKKVAC